MRNSCRLGRGAATALAIVTAAAIQAQSAAVVPGAAIDLDMVSGGPLVSRPVAPGVLTGKRWTALAWVQPRAAASGEVAILTIGGAAVMLNDGAPSLRAGTQATVPAGRLAIGRWSLVAISRDGDMLRLWIDGRATGSLPVPPVADTVGDTLAIGGHQPAVPGFAGLIAGARAMAGALSAAEQRARAGEVPNLATRQFATNSASWLPQVRQMYGQIAPQPPETLPRSQTPPDLPIAKPIPRLPELAERAPGLWTVNGWRLAAAPDVAAAPEALSRPGFQARAGWQVATVPGTVLTTLVDRGVYADPAHGLNNLAIPYDLAKKDWWYRTEFELPSGNDKRHLELVLNGVNYAAELWVNGARLGTMKGAFIRGRFDVSAALQPGRNAIAVRVSPPPHPGLAHEESLTAGVGENGGMEMLDGPTFGAAEGWDWIPTVRDRNTGLWQGVDLVATGAAKLGDAQVVTTLPRPDNSVADVEISVPVRNQSAQPITAEVTAAFDEVSVHQSVTVAPGSESVAVFRPTQFPQLSVRNPKLWWPNGYGDPALHDLRVAATVAGAPSDAHKLRFGMRQVTYDMSLMNRAGELRRVEVNLSRARALGQRVVDNSHTGIREVQGGWAYSLAPGAETSAAIRPVTGEEGLTPYLALKINGVRIAARGGSVGMDDFMKRTERSRLEPFFKLQRDAHMNIVRNWVGQDTEDNFFDLADEYGMMVLSDFWESTQDYNAEAVDVPLFVANADDVVRRYRNHPSIVAWFGRNEGVPQPGLNEELDRTVRQRDGTRLYMPSSNRINLHNSGPYNWQPPMKYFTEFSQGFAVEVGTPSFPTLESWKRAISPSERWPISDSWAYHDWHQVGNGGVQTYMEAMRTEFGAATSLEDFERKAQMLQYESYRAIFEGMNAGLWTTNSARMLWMTQPAWPSSAWQIFSSDYDTHAAFYGVKKASEPLHVQMNLPDYKVIIVNNGRGALAKTTVRARVVALDGRVLLERNATVSGPANAVTDAFTLDLAPALGNGPVLVRLEALDASGQRRSDNFYWQANDPAQLQALNRLAPVTLEASASLRSEGDETVVAVSLANRGSTPAIETKLTMFGAEGKQVLPALFSDNYVSLLPGEARQVEVRFPTSAGKGALRVALRGWNIVPASVSVHAAR